ncbi:MAG: zinc metallopeptidase [Chloroflexota bacterium]|nr:zinc metallopeptidase [Chloroflexota bacterium]
MRLSFPGRRSTELKDYRGASGASGGGMGLPIGVGAGLGIPGIIIAIVLTLVFGGNPLGGGGSGYGVDQPFQQFPSADQLPEQPIPREIDPNAATVDFVSVVLDDVQASWAQEFQASGQSYEPAHLILFTDAIASGCGQASAATGPFYCPADGNVYLDIAFFDELSQRFGAPGDFAQAYVIAHELGHHVQQLTGISAQVDKQVRSHPDQTNALSVRVELQADCLAGVWGYTAAQRGLLEPGDVDEGLAAAASVGDDRIQKATTGRIDPETWTHGSAAQRSSWFKRGFDGGNPDNCDTFSGNI